MRPADPAHEWLERVVERHTRRYSTSEFTKAVRALSARYVERRADLGRRSPIDSAGKRAAFAGFFAPMHFLTARAVLDAMRASAQHLDTILDLGCGTGAAGAAWALASHPAPDLLGIDRDGWVLTEAAWNWDSLGLGGRTRRGDLADTLSRLSTRPARELAATGVMLGWAVNELDARTRERVLGSLTSLVDRGATAIVIEPLSRAVSPWWPVWVDRLAPHGARQADAKFDAALPPRLASLAESAGLRRDVLGARVLVCGGRGTGVGD
jgi:hypothetical protein